MQAGGEQPWQHRTVLLHEAVESLVTTADGVYLDGTFGRGGHSRLILSKLSPTGRLLAIDRDPEAVAHAQAGPQAIADARFSITHTSFAHLADTVRAQGVSHVDGVLLDIGVSSPQIDNPERGFSFRFNGPLDMRMDTTRGESAAEFLQRADEQQIAEVIRDYGEERFAVSIAKALVARRASGQPVATTAELSEVVARAVKTREAGQDPATRTFQALRIYVNAELEELEQGLSAALELLAPQGRLVVISFHSLEDRIVKTFIARHSKREVDRRSPAYMLQTEEPMLLNAVARIKPSETEVRDNPRSRSAILRVAERTDAPYVAEPVRHEPAQRGRSGAGKKKGRAA
jgi:16S rRNA (cytosine1402-N4)-methyltransferase